MTATQRAWIDVLMKQIAATRWPSGRRVTSRDRFWLAEVLLEGDGDSTAPDPSWTEDADGYVVASLDWKGELSA